LRVLLEKQDHYYF